MGTGESQRLIRVLRSHQAMGTWTGLAAAGACMHAPGCGFPRDQLKAEKRILGTWGRKHWESVSPPGKQQHWQNLTDGTIL